MKIKPTQIKTVKLSELYSNPFQTDGLDNERVQQLIISMKGVGFMGSLEAQKHPKTGKLHLVFGHHRKAAAQTVFGKDFPVEVKIQDWDEENLMRGNANENLTQNDDPHRWIKQIADVKAYLMKRSFVRNPDKTSKRGIIEGRPDEPGSLNDICNWLNKFGLMIRRERIQELLSISENLAPELIEKIDKGAFNDEETDNKINLSNAIILASLGKDHKEQKDVLKALRKSKGSEEDKRVYRVRTRQKIITAFKKAKKKAENGDEGAKKEVEAVLSGKKDIALVGTGYIETADTPQEKAFADSIELRSKLTAAANEMDTLDMGNLSIKEMSKMAMFIRAWGENRFAPFYKKLINEITTRDGKAKGGVFVFNEEDDGC